MIKEKKKEEKVKVGEGKMEEEIKDWRKKEEKRRKTFRKNFLRLVHTYIYYRQTVFANKYSVSCFLLEMERKKNVSKCGRFYRHFMNLLWATAKTSTQNVDTREYVEASYVETNHL
jgi:hypothetical protein